MSNVISNSVALKTMPGPATPSFRLLMGAVCALLLTGTVQAAVTISSPEAANVNPAGFSAVWQISDNTGSTPGLDIFSDAAGTVSVRNQLAVEFFPVEENDPAVRSTFTQRQARRSLQTSLRASNVVLARITGAQPSTTYYFRPRSFDAAGVANEAGAAPLIPVTTALENAFIAESRQLRVDFATGFANSEGSLARLSVTGSPYPLVAIVGDCDQPGNAFFDLSRLLTAAGTTNMEFTGSPVFTLRLLGTGAPAGTYNTPVAMQGQYVVAKLSDTVFTIPFPGLSHFTVTGPANALPGIPYPLTITARQAGGQVLTTFNSTVGITASGTLLEGGGISDGFVNGVLTNYPVIVNAPGSWTITATRSSGTETGSLTVTANALNLASWKQFYFGANAGNPAIADFTADADGDGLSNGVEYATGLNPLAFSSGAISEGTLENGLFTFTYRKAKFPTDVTVQPRWSTDISVWRTDQMTQDIVSDDGVTQVIQVTVPAGTASRMYGKMEATTP